MSRLAGVKSGTRRRSGALREELHETVLECGMKACFLPKRGFRKRTALLATRYGSIDLVFRTSGGDRILQTPPGIAHFLEHQLFKKEGGVDLLTEFGRYGASANAFTEHTTTNYYYTTTEGFFPCLDLLLSLGFAPYFHPEFVAKEKQIIEQELRMYEDMPDYRGYRALLEALYRTHPVRIDIGGTVKSIQQITPELLEHCYRVFYHPTNLLFVGAGDEDPREVFAHLNRALPAGRFRGERVVARDLPAEPAGVMQDRIETPLTVSRPRVLIGLKDGKIGGDVLQRDLETTALLDLLFGKSSRFHQTWYEKGLLDDSFAATYTGESEFGFVVVGGETDDPEELTRRVRQRFESARDERFGGRDLSRIRRKMIGKYLRAFDSPEAAAFMVHGYTVRGMDPFSVPSAIQRITPGGLRRRLRECYRPENLAVSVVRQG